MSRQTHRSGRGHAVEGLEPRLVLSGFALGDLASFPAAPTGYDSRSSLVRDSAGDLFGTTYAGGAHDQGTVFELAAGSSAVTTLASFHGPDGANPAAGVTFDSAGNLFGTTQNGGASGVGTVFELAKGTSAVTTLASFTGDNGANPAGGVVLTSTGLIFGTTSAGGATGQGTVFQINLMGAGPLAVTTLASFDGTDGSGPSGALALDSSGNLFGAASAGGANSSGAVFEVVNGSGAVTALASFNGTNGATPLGGVVMDSSGNLFGAASAGGAGGNGTLFELAKGSKTLTRLALFNANDGTHPQGGLTLDASGNLFGTASGGGPGGNGTVFELANGATAVVTLAAFNGGNGATPRAGVVLDSAGDLFGTTSANGGANNTGNVYEVIAGSGTVTPLAPFQAPNGAYPLTGVAFDASGNLYGTTETGGAGGASGDGRVYEIAKGSTAITTVASFTGADGAYPQAGVTFDSAGNLFGTTAYGGADGDGVVYEIAAGSSAITALASFNGINGATPDAGVTLDAAGNLFGTTQYGGDGSNGVVFEVAKGTNAITALGSFNGTNGANPAGGVVLDAAGNLFGTAQYGGDANSDGAIWEIAKGSNTIIPLALFNGANGAYPLGDLAIDGTGNLFGATQGGGDANGDGAVFEVAKGTGAITALALFDGANGSNPAGGVALDIFGDIFGTAQGGGDNGGGDVWEVIESSNAITPVASFNGANGFSPSGDVVFDSSNALFGTTPVGGAANTGAVFELYQPAKLAFLQPPANATAGAPLNPPVTVAVQDSSGSTLLADASTVTLTLSGGTFAGGGTTATATAVNGVATFNDLVVDSPGSYSLTASDAAYSLSTAPAPFTVSTEPTITNVGITDSATSATTAAQRSQVRGLVLTFSGPTPTFSASQLSLSLLNSGGSGANDNSAPTPLPSSVFGTPTTSDGGTTWVVPFLASTANTSATGSLNDGIYTLSIGGVSSGGVTSLTFHRLFGDLDGNKTVNALDYARFKSAFGASTGSTAYNPDLDFDDNGTINALDYSQFKSRFGKTFTYT